MKKILIICFLAVLFSAVGVAQDVPVQTTTLLTDSADFKSDGCSLFPDGNYRDCCFAHDQAYYAGGSWKLRWRADKKLFKCVAAKPKFYNKLVAPMMWLGVRVGGVSVIPTPFRWGFGKNKKRSTPILKTSTK